MQDFKSSHDEQFTSKKKKKTRCDSYCLFKSSKGSKTSLSFASCSWNWFQTLSTQMKMMNLLFPVHTSDQNISILDKDFSRKETKPLTYSSRGRQSMIRPRSQQSIPRTEMNESTCFQLQIQKQVNPRSFVNCCYSKAFSFDRLNIS